MMFARPEILWLLLLVPALGAIAMAARAARRRRLRRFASDALLPRLVVGGSWGREAILTSLRLGAIGLVTLALARPQWGRHDEPVVRRGVDVVLALDLSASMLAEDVSPSRFEQARAEASSLLGSLNGDRVGLVVFGGRAAAPCPLTLDYGAVRLFLDAAEPDFVPGPGSDLGRALEEATKLFNASERGYKTIVLLTDGEDLEGHGDEAAGAARKDGIVIHAIGVGTESGGPIPLRDDQGALTGYKKDHDGRVVTTRFDPTTLEKIVVQGSGMFLHAGPAGEEGRRVADAIGQMEKKEISSRLATRFEDRYQIPLAAALALLLVESAWIGRRPRRRSSVGAAAAGGREAAPSPSRRSTATAALALIVAVLAAATLPVRDVRAQGSPPASGAPDDEAAGKAAAQGWPGDTRPARSAPGAPAAGRAEPAPREDGKAPPAAARKNRQANRLYDQKSYDQALSKYEEASAAAPDLPSLRYNIGNTLYREGKYAEAASEYTKALAKAGKSLAPALRYNLGNTHFQQQQYKDAVDAYRRVLEERPADEAARRNLELALRALRQKEQQQKQDQKKDDKKDDKKPQDKQQKPQESPGKKQDKPKDEPKPDSGDQQKPGDQEKPGDQGKPNPSGPQGKPGASGADGKIGKKDAEKLLDSLAQEEKRDLRKRLARLPQDVGPEKDW